MLLCSLGIDSQRVIGRQEERRPQRSGYFVPGFVHVFFLLDPRYKRGHTEVKVSDIFVLHPVLMDWITSWLTELISRLQPILSTGKILESNN